MVKDYALKERYYLVDLGIHGRIILNGSLTGGV
jgi:hypothetical protein